MSTAQVAAFDGTTGRSGHGGRRTHIIQLLRDTPEPVGVAEVAAAVGVRPGTARAHLEALVDAGMAQRTQQPRDTPGRPRVLYDGVLPNQTHERAQGYRLLSTLLVAAVVRQTMTGPGDLRGVGAAWGRQLVEADGPTGGTTAAGAADLDEESLRRLVAKLDALWFAPELVEPGCEGDLGGEVVHEGEGVHEGEVVRHLTMHHCPLRGAQPDLGREACTLHAGLVDGALEALGAPRRLLSLVCEPEVHRCVATLGA